MLRSICN